MNRNETQEVETHCSAFVFPLAFSGHCSSGIPFFLVFLQASWKLDTNTKVAKMMIFRMISGRTLLTVSTGFSSGAQCSIQSKCVTE